MLWLFLILASTFVIRKKIFRIDDFEYGRDEKLITHLLGLVIGSVLYVFLTVLVVDHLAEWKWDLEREVKLVSLRNYNDINGTFVLGTGSVNSKQYFYYYQEVAEGMTPGRHAANQNTIIRETGESTALLKTYRRTYANTLWSVVAPPVWHKRKYVFEVPRGTVIREFKLM